MQERGGRVSGAEAISLALAAEGTEPKERAVDVAVAMALLRIVPLSWRTMRLEVRARSDAAGQSFTYNIIGPDGEASLVDVDEGLQLAVGRLYEFTAECQGRAWRAIDFSVTRTEGEDWRYDLQFRYS